MHDRSNSDPKVVQGFGEEWARFTQSELSTSEREEIFHDYFSIFPWNELPKNSIGADIGCGSGRWATVVSPRVGKLFCVDASSDALDVAKTNLAGVSNVTFHQSDVGQLPFDDEALDFAYSLGVLHHVPDTAVAIRSISKTLKRGGIFLVYLYYAFDNRPWWYRHIWNISDTVRSFISQLPRYPRHLLCDALAAFVYWPLARSATLLARIGYSIENFPLWYYRDKSFYVMRTDALDRFGTRLEKRFTRDQITAMLTAAGFRDISFSNIAPYWCAIARKR
jgi:SAM-dependent methyltransferase